MKKLFEKAGYTIVFGKEKADVCVINTCTVTGTGAQKSRQQIRRARRENPDAVIAVCGCLAQTESEKLKNEMDIDVLIGNNKRAEIVELVKEAVSGKTVCKVEDILKVRDFEEIGITEGQSRVRANLKIEDGCDNFCSYCIIPFARGPVRSRGMGNIIEEAKALGKSGYGEVVLTGIHIGSYGKDLKNGKGLIDVIEEVHKIDGIERIRLGSLEPVMITEDFVKRAKKLTKLCPQFHMSLQSGCDETLLRMKRRYTTDEYKKAVELLRENIPETAITTDLMVGFAGETEEEFEKSYNFCREIGFSQMHIFPYSVREGTAAEKLPNQVPENVKTERSQKMLELAEQMKAEFYNKYIGKTVQVLAEQKKGELWHSTTANYMDVYFKCEDDISGKMINIKIKSYESESLKGEI